MPVPGRGQVQVLTPQQQAGYVLPGHRSKLEYVEAYHERSL